MKEKENVIEYREVYLPSHLEVVDQPDLVLGAIRGEPNAPAPKHKVGKLDQIWVLLNEILDAIPVLIECCHEELLEVGELVLVVEREGEARVEFVCWGAANDLTVLLYELISIGIKDLRRESLVEVQEEVC